MIKLTTKIIFIMLLLLATNTQAKIGDKINVDLLHFQHTQINFSKQKNYMPLIREIKNVKDKVKIKDMEAT